MEEGIYEQTPEIWIKYGRLEVVGKKGISVKDPHSQRHREVKAGLPEIESSRKGRLGLD